MTLEQHKILHNRIELETLEVSFLAPYAQFSSKSAGREHFENEPETRTQFQRDWHRITHCRAFRKLEFKTQVFVFGEGEDVSRNRLTHTLEVSQIATSICRRLGLNEDLAQAIALAHDLGHPPFGHAGEQELQELVHSFNHNLHGLRIVRELEKRYPDFDGINLTFETLEGMDKHNTNYDKLPNHYFFKGLQPTLETQVVNLSDSIAYRSHDVEDGLASGIITPEMITDSGSELLIDSWEKVKAYKPEIQLAQISRNLIDAVVQDVVKESYKQLNDNNICSLDDVRKASLILIRMSKEMETNDSILGSFLLDNFYKDYRVLRATYLGRKVLRDLFFTFSTTPELLPKPIMQRYLDANEGVIPLEPVRVLADYLASHTDRSALEEHKKIFGN